MKATFVMGRLWAAALPGLLCLAVGAGYGQDTARTGPVDTVRTGSVRRAGDTGVVRNAQRSQDTGRAQDTGRVRNVQKAGGVGRMPVTEPGRVRSDTGGLKKPVLLREVIVSARPPLVQRLVDRTVINVESSISMASSTVWELMKQLPGVQVEPDGTISLNGKAGVTVYLDGRATYLSADDLAALLRGMSAAGIRKIELMPNPSAKYDAAGTGGIINIIRKKEHKQGWNGNIRGDWRQSRYGNYGGGGNFSYHHGIFNGNLSADFSDNDVLSGTDQHNEFYNDAHRLLSLQVGELRDLTKTRSGTVVFMGDLDLSKRTSLSVSATEMFQSVRDITTSRLDQWDSLGVKTGGQLFEDALGSHNASFDGSARLVHQLDTSGQELSVEMNLSSYPGNPRQYISRHFYDGNGTAAGDSSQLLNRNRNTHIYVAKIDYTRPLPGKLRLETGMKSSYVAVRNVQQYYTDGGNGEYTPGSGGNEITGEYIHALYLSMNKMYKRLELQAGLRAEESLTRGRSRETSGALGTGGTGSGSGSGGIGGSGGSSGSGGTGTGAGDTQSRVSKQYLLWFPSLSFRYNISDKHSLGLEISRRVLRPSYRQLNPLHDPLSATSYYVGDPNLRPQMNTNIELSYAWANAITINFGGIRYRDFYRSFTFIDSDRVTTIRMPANIHNGWAYYCDLSGSQQLRPWWQMNLDLNIYERWFTGLVRGQSVRTDPLLTIKIQISNELTLGRGWSGEWSCKYVSTRQIISSRYGPYSNFNFGLRRKLSGGKGSLFANVYNLFEKEGNTSLEMTGNLTQTGYLYTYSRSVNAGMTYRLGSDRTERRRRARTATEEQQRSGN